MELTVELLKQAILDATDWLEIGEGVSLTYYARDAGAKKDDISIQVIRQVIREAQE